MSAFARFKTGVNAEEGRDNSGRWMRLKRIDEINTQTNLNV